MLLIAIVLVQTKEWTERGDAGEALVTDMGADAKDQIL